MTEPAIRRRQSIEVPGDHLARYLPPEERLIRLAEFAEMSGLDIADLRFTPYLTTPIPAPDKREGRGWPGLRAEAMWHPLFWLSQRMIAPRVFDGDHAITWDEMLAAIGFELTEGAPIEADGRLWARVPDPDNPIIALPEDAPFPPPLYDLDTGTWLDIPATVGVDIDTPEGLARIRSWLAGGEDDALDSIDIDAYLLVPGRDPYWATQHLLNPDAAGHSFFTDLADGYDHSTYEHLAQRVRSFSGETVDKSRDEVQELVSLADVCTNYGIAERQGLAERVETTDDEYVLIEALATLAAQFEELAVELAPADARLEARIARLIQS